MLDLQNTSCASAVKQSQRTGASYFDIPATAVFSKRVEYSGLE